MKNYLLICGIFLAMIASPAFGTEEMDALKRLDPVYVDYIKAELANSYRASDSTVNERYRGGTLEPFQVGYLEIPIERLNIETSHANDLLIEQHFYTEKNGKKFVRFFVHPDSEHLYQPLINEFGYKGFYWALPTSSTRSVLAWDPSRPKVKPVFLKLSLAQLQDRLGRIIPGWEVRRSVRVTEMVDADIRSGRVQRNQVHIIPEVAGAYVKEAEGLKFHVDRDQGDIAEHGYILRDASFIEKYQSKRVVPMFWLFSKNGGAEPPIIRMWKESSYFPKDGGDLADSFSNFLADTFYRPFIQMNLPLMLQEGIVPQIHGQNVILILDPETNRLESCFHRDIGSMKSDYRLRWIRGLPTSQLRSLLADKDFGLSWGAEKIEPYHNDYLHGWLLQWTYLGNIREHIKNFAPKLAGDKVRQILDEEVTKALRSPKEEIGPTARILKFIEKNPPPLVVQERPMDGSAHTRLRTFLIEREGQNQAVPLPSSWQAKWNSSKMGDLKEKGFALTSYGILYSDRYLGRSSQEMKIAFFSDLSGADAILNKKEKALPVSRHLTCHSAHRAAGSF